MSYHIIFWLGNKKINFQLLLSGVLEMYCPLQSRPRDDKAVFMLNATVHEIDHAHKC